MQDNLKHLDIDKKFIRQSWQAMEDRLDNEMPVMKAGNKLTALLSALLLLSLIGLAYFAYLYYNTSPTANNAKEQVRYERIYIPQVQIQAYNPDLLELTEIHTPSSHISDITDVQPGTIHLKSPSYTLPPLGFQAFGTIGSGLNKNAFGAASMDNIDSANHGLDADNNHTFAAFNDNMQLIEPARTQHKNKLNPFFALNGFISNLSYSGYGVHLGLDFPVSSRFSLQTGVGLNFISRNYFIFPFFEKDSEINLKSGNADLNDPDTYYASLKGFKQVVIPFGINYSLNRRFDLTTGLKLRYTYTETIDQTFKTKVAGSFAGDQSIASNFFNNSNIGLYAGVNFNVTEAFSVSIDSEWGVHSLIKNNPLLGSGQAYRKYDLNLVNVTSYFKF